MEKKEEEETKY